MHRTMFISFIDLLRGSGISALTTSSPQSCGGVVSAEMERETLSKF